MSLVVRCWCAAVHIPWLWMHKVCARWYRRSQLLQTVGSGALPWPWMTPIWTEKKCKPWSARAGDSKRHRFAKPEDMDSVLAELGLANARGYTRCGCAVCPQPGGAPPQTRVRLIRYASDKTGEAYLDDKQLQGPMVRILQQVF